MDPDIKKAIEQAVDMEPFAKALKMRLIELTYGRSLVEMTYEPDKMDNIYSRAHGGAIFSLIDEAFETASQTDGTIAVALNVNVTYIASPRPEDRLTAEARMSSRSKKTSSFDITVKDSNGKLIAKCAALAYRTGKPIPFLEKNKNP